MNEEAKPFVDILSKLNNIETSTTKKDVTQKRLPGNDMFDILHNFNNASKGVVMESAPDTLDATQKAKPIKVLDTPTDPDHPFDGELVGEAEEVEEGRMSDQVIHDSETLSKEEFAKKHGKEMADEYYESVIAEATDLYDQDGLMLTRFGMGDGKLGLQITYGGRYIQVPEHDVERLASALQSAATKMPVNEQPIETTEDIISDLKDSLSDYLKDLSKDIKKGTTDLKSKDSNRGGSDELGPVVKTMTTKDGEKIKIHGSEDDGFRISIKAKPMKSKFKSIDEAVMAFELYQKKSTDYISES